MLEETPTWGRAYLAPTNRELIDERHSREADSRLDDPGCERAGNCERAAGHGNGCPDGDLAVGEQAEIGRAGN